MEAELRKQKTGVYYGSFSCGWITFWFHVFQMATPFLKAVSTDQTMSLWPFPSAPSSKTCLWTSVWTCAQRRWGSDHVYVCWFRSCVFVQMSMCVTYGMVSVFQEKSLAVLAGDRCYCGFPTPLFSLHELENEDMCLHRCHGEEFESCGNDEYFVVYQTQVQGKHCWLTPCCTVTALQYIERTFKLPAGNTYTTDSKVVYHVWKNTPAGLLYIREYQTVLMSLFSALEMVQVRTGCPHFSCQLFLKFPSQNNLPTIKC